MRRSCRQVPSSLFLICALVVAVAPPQRRQTHSPRFQSDVEWVQVWVTVQDASGRMVSGLSQHDFDFFEDGVKQELTFFSSDPQPISLAIICDVSRSMLGERHAAAARAVETLLGGLGPEDEGLLYAFNDDAVHVSEWTAQVASLPDVLKRVTPEGGTRLYGSIVRATHMLATARSRRKALVLISDGNDSGREFIPIFPGSNPYESEKAAVRQLRRGEATLHAVGIDWPRPPDPTRPPSRSDRVDIKTLRRLASETGGTAVLASSEAHLLAAARLIVDELHHQYTAAYAPPKAPDGRYRRVKVVLRDPALTVRARPGYTAEPVRSVK